MNAKHTTARTTALTVLACVGLCGTTHAGDGKLTYPIVDTGQAQCYSNAAQIAYPKQQEAFFGQDALCVGNEPSYRNNGDGTVTDLVTGLVWQKDPGAKKTFAEAVAGAKSFRLAGKSDWRLPTIKELYSLIDFRGYSMQTAEQSGSYLNTDYFRFSYGDARMGERVIDAQFWTSTTHLEHYTCGAAVYVCFGEAFGYMGPPGAPKRKLDVHGAGAQRSDPKAGDPAQFPTGRGPQGDEIRIYNYVRCVRGGTAKLRSEAPKSDRSKYPHNVATQPANNGAAFGPPLGPPGRGGFVRRLDRDGDGKVSRDEFDGPPDQFDVLDRNRDGFLSDTEAPPPPPGPGRW